MTARRRRGAYGSRAVAIVALAVAGLTAALPARADRSYEQLIPVQELVSMPYHGVRCFQGGVIVVQADRLDYVKLWRDSYGNLRRIDFKSGVNAVSSIHIADGTTCVVGPQ